MSIYGYIRVSHIVQKKSGLGLTAQRRKIEECARSLGQKIARFFSDPAVSGSRVPFLKRKGGHELDAILVPGDRIVIAKLDRAFRNLGDFAAMLERWQTRGVFISLLDIGVDTSSPVGRLIAGIMAAVAEWESRRIGERIREALLVRRSQGRSTNGEPAIGWKKIRKRVYPNPAERKVGREVLRLHRQGNTYQQVAEILNRRKVLRRGHPWTHSVAIRWATAARHKFPITGYHGVRADRTRARARH